MKMRGNRKTERMEINQGMIIVSGRRLHSLHWTPHEKKPWKNMMSLIQWLGDP